MGLQSEGRRIHNQALEKRESGDFLESLKLDDEAMVAYQKEDDSLGFAEALADRSLTLRHLFQTTGSRNYLLLAESEMEGSVNIAQESGNKKALAVPLFNLAKVQEELEAFEDAVDTYKQAIENMENNPPETHDRPAVLLDMKIHLCYSEYKSGDKSAYDRMVKFTEELEKCDEDSYNKKIWLSGAYMSIAEMLLADNPEKAKDSLGLAKEVIDSDERLILRKKQWEKLAKAF